MKRRYRIFFRLDGGLAICRPVGAGDFKYSKWYFFYQKA